MMTNYSLEEFKAWLEEKPERKEIIDLPRIESALSGTDLTNFFTQLREKARTGVFNFALDSYDS
jgi:hypothetical protein